MVRYTISIINYNMADTIEESLRSVLDQLTDEFEVLVVDGGSTDGSLEILSSLSDEYENLRYFVSPYGCNGSRGTDRALSVTEAEGEFVLTHIDVDDKYYEVIRDFVHVFHDLDDQLETDLVLWGSHMAIARKDRLLRLGSYRNLNAGEDMDLFRRAIASETTTYLELDTARCWESLGYRRGPLARIVYKVEIHTCDFQSGIPLANALGRSLNIDTWRDRSVYLVLLLVAYLRAQRREQFELPEQVQTKGLQFFEAYRYTAQELEAELGMSVDASRLSATGREYLLTPGENGV